jgi:hypothetical protein
MPGSRRFPPPWTVEETAPCFIVRDAHWLAIAYVHFEKQTAEDAGVPLAVVLNYSDAERRPHRSVKEGGGCLECVA